MQCNQESFVCAQVTVKIKCKALLQLQSYFNGSAQSISEREYVSVSRKSYLMDEHIFLGVIPARQQEIEIRE